MNILLLTTHLRMGGVSIYVVTLAKAMRRLGHTVFVASCGGELAKRVEKEGITHITLAIDTKSELDPKIFIASYRLFWFIKENRISIVHTNTRVTQAMGELLAFFTSVVHVSTCHGFFKPRLGRRIFGCWGKKVIAISEAVREHLVNDFKVEKSRIDLINNGIDLDASNRTYSQEEKRIIRKEVELKDGPVVGIVARLSSVKGHRYLVAAMGTVVKTIRDAQLLIVGEGPEEENIKNMVKELGLTGSVVFAKTVPDTIRVLSVMDLFVLSSIHEGLGLAILEALSCGLPVVASDTGGIYSIIKDNVTGLLVPPRDPEALAGAIIKVLSNKEWAGQLALAGKKFVSENFSLDEMARRVQTVYQGAAV